MKTEDFAIIQRSAYNPKKILAYHVYNIDKLREYFKFFNYKPSPLAKQLNMHYQSLRKLLQENNLWVFVRTSNGKGIGPNTRKKVLKNAQGYAYTEDLNSYQVDKGRSRRKLKHIEVMEKYLNRGLVKGEVVHHIDCDKLNNNIENLFLCSRSEHSLLHKQLESVAIQLIKEKLIYFCFDSKKYIKKG